MARQVLVTGGAGFIGSHTCDLLLAKGYRVRVLDSLSPQVHGNVARPDYLNKDVELLVGDIRDATVVAKALDGVDEVLHFAALVGVGQSMYDIAAYTGVNDLGTAVLLEAISKKRVSRLVVASSMSVYGEGLARDSRRAEVNPSERGVEQMKRGVWELQDDSGADLSPLPTPETKAPALSSVYALNKYVQERLCLIAGQAYGIPTVALRFFNVYGTRQALSNPYTGVLAIFASRLLNDKPPMIFEDGLQQRDFIHVEDVARACLLALRAEAATGQVINIGSGQNRTVQSIARDLSTALGKSIPPLITGRYRAGDIRHCFADTQRAEELLGFKAEKPWEQGIAELTEWLADQVAVDHVESATAELEKRGLVA